MKVYLIGNPKKGQNGDVSQEIEDEWVKYSGLMCSAALEIERSEDSKIRAIYPEWLGNSYIGVPQGRDIPSMSRTDMVSRLNTGGFDIDTRFEWSPDPMHPLRLLARVYSHRIRMIHSGIDAARNALNEVA